MFEMSLRPGLERIDRLVHPCLRFLAGEAGRDGVAEAEGDGAGLLAEQGAAPEAAAVDGEGDDRQAERAVEAGEAWLERGRLAVGHAGAFGEYDQRPAVRDRF